MAALSGVGRGFSSGYDFEGVFFALAKAVSLPVLLGEEGSAVEDWDDSKVHKVARKFLGQYVESYQF
ncbi:MAG: hypothetical protein KR126chlam1_01205 [Chlamydiae bacterium]|nr:hypothetical protein [Chlamydiota bacterium]